MTAKTEAIGSTVNAANSYDAGELNAPITVEAGITIHIFTNIALGPNEYVVASFTPTAVAPYRPLVDGQSRHVLLDKNITRVSVTGPVSLGLEKTATVLATSVHYEA